MSFTRAAAALLMLSLTSSVQAQSAFARSATADPPGRSAEADRQPALAGRVAQRPDPGEGGEAVDVSRLPLNLDRIQRGLRQSAIREEREGLNLRYVVEVYGQAPPFVLFGPEDNLVHGPVPYGAPTHRDMIAHVTPKEFRTTGAGAGADVGALFRWLAEKSKK